MVSMSDNGDHVTIDTALIEAIRARDWYQQRMAPPTLVPRRRLPPPPPPTRPGSPTPAVIDESAAAFVGSPRNFLKPELRRSWVTPAGTSEYGDITDPHPGRITSEMRRAQRNEVARAAEAATRMSGSATVRAPKEAAQAGFTPTVNRDRFGRLTTSWQRQTEGEQISEA